MRYVSILSLPSHLKRFVPASTDWLRPAADVRFDTFRRDRDSTNVSKNLIISRLCCAAAAALLIGTASASESQIQFQVVVEPFPAEFAGLESTVSNHVLRAAGMWGQHINAVNCATNCAIAIEFRIQKSPTPASGHSLHNAPFNNETYNGKIVMEEGMAYKLRTGKAPDGQGPDVEIVIDPAYFKTLWWDPDLQTRNSPLPGDKLDALSVILRELGHALAFNGFINPVTGNVGGTYISTYDRWVASNGFDFSFSGPTAVGKYGKPIPLATKSSNYFHVGDDVLNVDPVLKSDVMNGIGLQRGQRYSVSPLDIAILADCGLPVK
jgi:hypothetical protein